jgi:ribA/ribD-fused uncharacterized protein
VKYSRQHLEQAAARGEPIKYLFFWGHKAGRGGAPGPGCLSQWWEAAFVVEGQRYPSAEHFMMAEKARLFGDEATRARVLSARTPGEAKALGREVSGFDEERWTQARYDVVRAGSVAKFSAHPDLLAFLRTTGSKVLVEASPTDRIWGIGLAQDDPRAQDPRTWRGHNLLGFALMEARDLLAE